ncbi:MAG TPA: KamA family radical SAM protein, partial [bacterium]|nr:KamA family radical SAM protein [bacterium]
LGEEKDSVLPNLVHRYPDRVLLLATDHCAAYCRYCTRKRVVGSGNVPFSRTKLQAAFDYIAAHPEIRDVLVSGGDPLILNDEQINWILTSLRAIPHVEFLRMGTRVPLFMPQRITDELLATFKSVHPFFLSVHFNHPDELTTETRAALNRIADAGVPMGSQTVLLRGINDDPAVMKKLMHELLKCRVRPYYIYQCDLVEGAEHFRTDIGTGIRIIEALRGHTTGYAVPTFVVDLPGGGGKVPVGPDYVVAREGNTYRFRNYAGEEFTYTEVDRDALPEPEVITAEEREAVIRRVTRMGVGV